MLWTERNWESFAAGVVWMTELNLKGSMISSAQPCRLFENFHIIKREVEWMQWCLVKNWYYETFLWSSVWSMILGFVVDF